MMMHIAGTRVLRLSGRIAVVGLLAFAWAGFARPALAQEKEGKKLPDAEKILEKSIEALGGRAAFEKLHNRVAEGTVEIKPQGISGTIITYAAAPSKSYTQFELAGIGKQESGTDGNVHWQIAVPMPPRILDGPELARSKRDSRFNSLLYWKESFKKVECTGIEDVDGRECYKIAMTPQEGPVDTVYYDRNTYLPVKMAIRLQTVMGELPAEVLIDDYKKNGEVRVAHKMILRAAGTERVIVFQRVRHNVDLPKDRFDLPKEIQELQKAVSETKPAGGLKPAGADKK